MHLKMYILSITFDPGQVFQISRKINLIHISRDGRENIQSSLNYVVFFPQSLYSSALVTALG